MIDNEHDEAINPANEALQKALAFNSKDAAKNRQIEDLRKSIAGSIRMEESVLRLGGERSVVALSNRALDMLTLSNLTRDPEDYKATLAVYNALVEAEPVAMNFLGRAIALSRLNDPESSLQNLLVLLQLPVPYENKHRIICGALKSLVPELKDLVIEGVRNGSIDPGLVDILRQNCETDLTYAQAMGPLLPLFQAPLLNAQRPLVFSPSALRQPPPILTPLEENALKEELLARNRLLYLLNESIILTGNVSAMDCLRRQMGIDLTGGFRTLLMTLSPEVRERVDIEKFETKKEDFLDHLQSQLPADSNELCKNILEWLENSCLKSRPGVKH